jgi:hypothetical protein
VFVDGMADLYRRRRRQPRQDDLAAYLPGEQNARQIRRWLTQWTQPIVWDELVAAAKRQAAGS